MAADGTTTILLKPTLETSELQKFIENTKRTLSRFSKDLNTAIDPKSDSFTNLKTQLTDIQNILKKPIGDMGSEDVFNHLKQIYELLDSLQGKLSDSESQDVISQDSLNRGINRLDTLRKKVDSVRADVGTTLLNPTTPSEAPKSETKVPESEEPKMVGTISNEELVNAIDNYRDLLRQKSEFEKSGLGPGFKEYDDLTTRLSSTKDKYQELLKIHNKVVASTNAVPQARDSLSGLKEAMSNFSFGDAIKNSFEDIKANAKSSMASVVNDVSKAGTSFINSFRNPVTAGTSALQMLKIAGKGVGAILAGSFKLGATAAQTLAKGVVAIASKIKELRKSSPRAGMNIQKSFKKALTTTAKLAFGVRSVYMLVRRLRQTAIQAINTIATQMPDFNNTMSELKTSLQQVKASLGTAIAPIITALAPLLNTVMAKLSQILETIGKIAAVMTHQNYIYKATTAWQDYADSVEGASEKLGAYDKLNVISDDSNSNTLDGVTYEKQEIGDDFLDFDPYALGQEFGAKLQAALDSIDWALINDKLMQGATIFSNFFNGLLETSNQFGVTLGTTIGDTIGHGVNTIINLFNTLYDNIHWDSLAQFFTDGLNGLISTVNWSDFGNAIGEWKSLIWTLLSDIFTNFNWVELGNSFAQGIQGIINGYDWDGLTTTIVTGVNGIFDTFYTTFTGIDWEGLATTLGTKFNDLVTGIDWFGIAQKLADSVNLVITTLGTWISTVDWKTLGFDLVGSITTWFNNIDWNAVGTTLFEFVHGVIQFVIGCVQGLDLAQTIKNLVMGVFEIIESIDWLALIGDIFTLIGNVLVQLVGGLGGLLAGLIGALIETVIRIFKDIPTKIGEVLGDIAQFFSDIGLDVVAGFIQPIADFFSDIGTWIKDNIFDPFVNWFKDLFGIASPSKVMEEQGGFIVEGFINPIKEIPDKIKEFFQKVKDKAVEIVSSMVEKIKSTLTNMKQVFSDVFNAIKNIIKTPINAVIGIINKLINGVVTGLNSVLKALNKLKITVPSWVTRLTGVSSFGFNFGMISAPQIPLLAQGAVIPPNNEFLAMLGDQKSGTNIEAPLDTIKQAVAEVLANTNTNGDIVLQLNSKVIARAVWDEEEKRYKQTGKLAY